MAKVLKVVPESMQGKGGLHQNQMEAPSPPNVYFIFPFIFLPLYLYAILDHQLENTHDHQLRHIITSSVPQPRSSPDSAALEKCRKCAVISSLSIHFYNTLIWPTITYWSRSRALFSNWEKMIFIHCNSWIEGEIGLSGSPSESSWCLCPEGSRHRALKGLMNCVCYTGGCITHHQEGSFTKRRIYSLSLHDICPACWL